MIICYCTFDAIVAAATPTIKIKKIDCHRYRILVEKLGILVVVTNGSLDNRNMKMMFIVVGKQLVSVP